MTTTIVLISDRVRLDIDDTDLGMPGLVEHVPSGKSANYDRVMETGRIRDVELTKDELLELHRHQPAVEWAWEEARAGQSDCA